LEIAIMEREWMEPVPILHDGAVEPHSELGSRFVGVCADELPSSVVQVSPKPLSEDTEVRRTPAQKRILLLDGLGSSHVRECGLELDTLFFLVLSRDAVYGAPGATCSTMGRGSRTRGAMRQVEHGVPGLVGAEHAMAGASDPFRLASCGSDRTLATEVALPKAPPLLGALNIGTCGLAGAFIEASIGQREEVRA
jgi:hypothetical protein